MTGQYRVGNHQPQNLYRGDAYIGVMFSPVDSALFVALGNAADLAPWTVDGPYGPIAGWIDSANQEHWLAVTGQPHSGWRQLYVKKEAE